MLESFKEFLKCFGTGYKKLIPIIIFGAAIAGSLELSGLLLLIPFIRLLIRPDSYKGDTFLTWLSDIFGAETPLQQACLLGGLIVLIFIIKNLYLIQYYFWQNKMIRRWKIDIGTTLMRFYLFSPYKLHLLRSSDKIVRNVNNTVLRALNQFVFQGFLLISNFIAGLVVVAILMSRTVIFTISTAIVLTISCICQYYFLRSKLNNLGKEKSELMSKQYKNIFEGLHAIKETKVLGREQFFLSSFKDINSCTVENDMWTLFYRQLPNRLTEITAIVGVVIMCVGVIHSNLGDNPTLVASLGILAAVSMRTSSVVNRILTSLQQINHSHSAVEILLKEVNSPEWKEYEESRRRQEAGQNDDTFTFNSEICFQNVSFAYPNSKKPALKNIDVTINKGEFIGIVGPSGAGKTTFVDILLGLLETEEGEVLIDGNKLGHENISHWQKRLGYVPQAVYISNDTAIRNVAFGIPDDEIDLANVNIALQKANMLEHLQTLTDGLETTLGENGRKLSGGQKQRIGIARALYNHSEILVLDEATSSLDVPMEGEISKAINSLKGQQTIIAIAHRLATLKSCDRIFYFDNGRLVDTGTFETLSQDHEKFDQMLQLSKIE